MLYFLNGKFVVDAQAVLPVSDLAIQRGYGIFDFFRLQEGVLLYVEDHLHRFLRSAEIMHIPVHQSMEELRQILLELTKLNGIRDAGIRMVLTGGNSPDAWQIGIPNLLIMQQELSIGSPTDEPKAVRVITHEYRRELPKAKTINYTTGVWLQKRMKEEQADDVIYHMEGRISELPRCNCFVVLKNGSVFTPDSDILEGVTRKRLLEQQEIPIETREVSLDLLKDAQEVFLTSSTKRVQSIISIDGKPVGSGRPGPVATRLLKILHHTERRYIESARSTAH
jgi:branched-chain amino acid aminotransferase